MSPRRKSEEKKLFIWYDHFPCPSVDIAEIGYSTDPPLEKYATGFLVFRGAVRELRNILAQGYKPVFRRDMGCRPEVDSEIKRRRSVLVYLEARLAS